MKDHEPGAPQLRSAEAYVADVEGLLNRMANDGVADPVAVFKCAIIILAVHFGWDDGEAARSFREKLKQDLGPPPDDDPRVPVMHAVIDASTHYVSAVAGVWIRVTEGELERYRRLNETARAQLEAVRRGVRLDTAPAPSDDYKPGDLLLCAVELAVVRRLERELGASH